jgi:hypothetical protein
LGPHSGTDGAGGIAAVEFRDNTYYNRDRGVGGSVMQIDESAGTGVTDVIVVNNVFNGPDSAIDSSGVTGTFTPNTFSPYAPPPTFTGGANR